MERGHCQDGDAGVHARHRWWRRPGAHERLTALLREKGGGLAKGGRPRETGVKPPRVSKPTLDEMGIDKDLVRAVEQPAPPPAPVTEAPPPAPAPAGFTRTRIQRRARSAGS
jgi:hypothetical protein